MRDILSWIETTERLQARIAELEAQSREFAKRCNNYALLRDIDHKRIAELEAALRLALEFWHSDHPNDTYEGADAHEKIVAALRSTKTEGDAPQSMGD